MNIKKLVVPFCIAFGLIIIGCTEKKVKVGELSIIPQPLEAIQGEGYFEIDVQTIVAVENNKQLSIAEHFFQQFEEVAGWKPMVKVTELGSIKFTTDKSLEFEAYGLEVSEKNIEIRAADNAGFLYALQSLKQLLPSEFYVKEKQLDIRWGVPVVSIKDAPTFEWRGYMLDVSRHFFDKEQVKEALDFMVELKLNRFHWHLADDQGWRIEIKGYPKLTEIGAWRVNHNITDETKANWIGRPVQKPGETPTYGGFYTQKEVKEIIAYAKDRNIEIIPEIDMPGHSQEIVAAYPELGCVNASPYVATGGVFGNNTLNPGKEITYEFAEDVLNEIIDLFPFEYVHIGGDECNKSQWKIDPYAQSKIKEEGLKDEHELQSYFIQRIEKIINARNRTMIGWDEILEGGLAPNATVMSWRGEAGGITSARKGHEVIMTPSQYCYLDLKQGHDDLEPNLGYSELLLSTSYNYKVVPDSLTATEAKLIKGIQGNLWTESISDWNKLTYMTFPRLYAVAENAWTPQENKNWNNFTDKLYTQFDRLDAQNIRYAVSAFSPWIDHKGNGENIAISMNTEISGLDIYYTVDGSEPTKKSTQYNGPFTIYNDAEIVARAFKNDEAVGYLSTMNFPVHFAAGAKVTSYSKDKKEMLTTLTDLNYGKLNDADPNWQTFAGDMEIDVQLAKASSVKQVEFNALRFSIGRNYPPEEVEVFGSEDGIKFEKLGSIRKKGIANNIGREKINYIIPLEKAKVKVLKIKAQAPTQIAPGYFDQETESLIKIDEIILRVE